MNLEALAAAIGLPIFLAAITGWISGGLASRRALAAAASDRRRRATSAMREAIQELHDLLWNAYIGEPADARDVADLMARFEGLVRRHEPLLPDGAGHLRQSAREAMACALGAPAAAALHIHARETPVEELDGYWADVSLTWLEHAVRQLHEWEDKPHSRRLALTPYFRWRRDEDDEARGRAQTAQPPNARPRAVRQP